MEAKEVLGAWYVDNRNEAPYVEYMTEDGPMIGVHPSVHGYSVVVETKRGELYGLIDFDTDDEERAQRKVAAIRHHLFLGKPLTDERWVFIRTMYGTPARAMEDHEAMESFVNAGGTREEWLANN